MARFRGKRTSEALPVKIAGIAERSDTARRATAPARQCLEIVARGEAKEDGATAA